MNQINFQRSIIKEEMYEAIKEPAKLLAEIKAKEEEAASEKSEQKEAKSFSTLHLPQL